MDLPQSFRSTLLAVALAAALAVTGCSPEKADEPATQTAGETDPSSTVLPTPLNTGAEARRERILGDGAFEVRFGDQGGFDETSDKALVEIAAPGIVALEAQGWYARISSQGLAEGSPEASTDSLDRLDTTVSLEIAANGEMVAVNCYAAETPRGTFRRTELTDTHVSGSFRVEIVRCDSFSGQEIDFPDEPFTVTGRYRHLPRTDGQQVAP